MTFHSIFSELVLGLRIQKRKPDTDITMPSMYYERDCPCKRIGVTKLKMQLQTKQAQTVNHFNSSIKILSSIVTVTISSVQDLF